MLRINQYRPNLRNSGKVKERQFSEKATPEGAEATLAQISYRGRVLSEEITEVTISYEEGKITGIHITCSDPQYDWDNGFHSFYVYYRARKTNWDLSYQQRAEEAEKHLINFLKEAEKYFKENDLNPRINKLEGYKLTDITIEEVTSSL